MARGRVTATILNGASLSQAVSIPGRIVGIIMPAVWTAADLSFQGSIDNVTYQELIDPAGANLSVVGPAGGEAVANLDLRFEGFPYIKVRSGTAGAPVNQLADRAIQIVYDSARA
jgi:hypothetical protein